MFLFVVKTKMDNKNLFADGIVDSCSPRKKTRAEVCNTDYV